MGSWAINNVTAPDAYTPSGQVGGATLNNLPVLDHINIDVTNQAIFWQLQLTDPVALLETQAAWDQEVYMTPGSRSLYRPGMCGIRIRAALTAASLPAGAFQAQVTVEAVQ